MNMTAIKIALIVSALGAAISLTAGIIAWVRYRNKQQTIQEDKPMKDKVHPKTVMHAWNIAISMPNEDSNRYRTNKNLTVYAHDVEEAYGIVRNEYPECYIWSAIQEGQRESKADGRIWERTWH